MNYHENQTKLRSLLHSNWRRKSNSKHLVSVYNAGVYLISQGKDSPFQKLGMASGLGGLYERLKNYKLCFANTNEYWMKYMIICPRKNIKVGNGKQSFARKMELLLGGGINSKSSAHYSSEWQINVVSHKLRLSIETILDANRKYWSYVLKFTEKGWVVVKNNQSINFNKTPTMNTTVINGIVKKPKLADLKNLPVGANILDETVPDPQNIPPILKKLKPFVPQKKKKKIPHTGYKTKKKISQLDAAEVLAMLSQ